MVRLTRIYTRHGDGGDTHLGDMSRARKTSPRVTAYGADLCVPGGEGEAEGARLRMVPAQVERLERWCDDVNVRLEPLTSFVLPGGTTAAAALHHARTVCRRAERAAVALADREPVTPAAIAYLNRLSDLLFILARDANRGAGGDVMWVPAEGREA